jgi:hypothetical protein
VEWARSGDVEKDGRENPIRHRNNSTWRRMRETGRNRICQERIGDKESGKNRRMKSKELMYNQSLVVTPFAGAHVAPQL